MTTLTSTRLPVWQAGKLAPQQDLWSLAVELRDDRRSVWGLAWDGHVTHMCYDLKVIPPAEAIARAGRHGWWSFDLGRDLRVKVDDLEQGFRALGLLPPAQGPVVRTKVALRGWHAGRAWHGTAIEDECPCPQEPCGLINLNRTVAGCKQHRPAWARSIRQWHPANRCPGKR